MEKIISIYILNAIKSGEFNTNEQIYWVFLEYFTQLVKIFDTDKNEIINITKRVFNSLNLTLIIIGYDDLTDNLTIPIEAIVEIKWSYARNQEYEMAAKFREIEKTLINKKTLDV